MDAANGTLSRAAERNALGPFIALHPGLQGYAKLALGSIAFGFVLVSSIWWIQYGSSAPGPVERIGLPAAGVLFIVVGLIGTLRLRGRAAQIHAEGIVYKQGFRIRVIPYRDVTGLDVDITEVSTNLGTHYRGTLRARLGSGATVKLSPNIENLDAVLDALIGGAAPWVVNHVVQQLRAGQTVDSGPISLTPSGIICKGTVVAYDALFSVHETRSMSFSMNSSKMMLEIRARGGETISVRAGKVPYRHYLEPISQAMAG